MVRASSLSEAVKVLAGAIGMAAEMPVRKALVNCSVMTALLR